MGEAKRRKRAGTYPQGRKLTIVPVGWGGLCGHCDEIHDPLPNPFIYTVGLTEQRRPELLLIIGKVPPGPALVDSGVGRELAEHLSGLLSALAELQQHRGKAFHDGEHIHGHEIKAQNCVKLVAIEPPRDGDIHLGFATQRYGKDGYRVMQVLLHDSSGRLQDDPLCEIASPQLHPRLHA